jgi:hypothetical protein
MRTTFSSVAILASSLLAREAFAAPYMQKREVVTDVVMVTEEITVTQEADGTYVTGLPAAIGTTIINGTPAVVKSTPVATPSSTEVPATAAPPAASKPPVSSSAKSSASTPGAVFIQESANTKASSTNAIVKPTSSTPAAVAPVSSTPAATTLAKVASAAAAASTSSSSSSGKKRGLAYNDASLLSGFVSSSSQVDWCYNWASSSATTPSGVEYVALLWGMQDEYTSVWNAHAGAALAAGSTHLMSFNEPDYSGQADLSVDAAVSGYMKYMQPFAGKAKLGAPAVTNGAAPMGLTYLGNFMNATEKAGGTVDFCAVHWYDSATNIAYFKNYMQEATNACNGKPIWLTEFGASGTADEQNTFLQTVLPWMDQQSYIERYAYFMVSAGSLISTGTTLSQLGNTFATYT